MASGAGYTGTLVTGDQTDYYFFYARPQDRVTLSLSEPTGFVSAVVSDSQGNTVCGSDTEAVDGLPITCVPGAANTAGSAAGVYYVEVAPGAAVTPVTYTVTVSGPLYDYNPVVCSSTRSGLRHDQAVASRDLAAARTAMRDHRSHAYARELNAYHVEQGLVRRAATLVKRSCSG